MVVEPPLNYLVDAWPPDTEVSPLTNGGTFTDAGCIRNNTSTYICGAVVLALIAFGTEQSCR
jgi:hypothetical protein